MYGAGTITYEKVGLYEYYALQYVDNTGKRRKKRFPHTKEGLRSAKQFQKEVNKKKATGSLVTTTKTLSVWLQEFLTTYKVNTLKISSLERLDQTRAIVEVSPIANIPLDKLNGAMIQNFYNMLADPWKDIKGKDHKALSSSTISKVHKLLVSAYKKAVQLRLIALNPMDTVDPVKVRTKEMSVFTWQEVGKIFWAIRKYDSYKFNNSQRYNYRLLFMMLLQTGCRVGELLALRWEDINFTKREIHIHSTKARDKQTFTDPKTTAGNRYVPIIFNKLLAALKEWRNHDGIIHMQGYVFENKNGGAVSYQRVFLTWQRICEIAGINKNIHTFRHTAATYLLEKGIPVAEVSRILGHADATITYKMYVHSIPNYNQKIIEQFKQKKITKSESDTKSDTIKSENTATMPISVTF